MTGCQILEYSTEFGLDANLVAAVAWHESVGGNIYATRFEEHWFKKLLPWDRSKLSQYGHVPPAPPSLLEEKRGRSTSYGLMQILGQTAREQGFKGRFMAELCDVTTNIFFGCKILAAKRKDALKLNPKLFGEALTNEMLLRYNGGANKDYPSYIRSVLESGDYKVLLEIY
jgi:soluble lytic murein transglycosylase-like protein